MSHPHGPLADNLTAYAIYATAQSEMRHAYTLIESGDFLAAATEIDSAAQAAETLARASETVDKNRYQHWQRVVLARRQFASRARAQAA